MSSDPILPKFRWCPEEISASAQVNPEWENGVQKAHGQESFRGVGQEQSVD